MLKTTFELSESIVPHVDNDLQVFSGAPIPPIERVGIFSPNQFEDFINEWATACLKNRYILVQKIGGANDKGRDIIAKIAEGQYDYYQCKHYDKSIAPSDIWVEFGKLCYYSYNGDYPLPQRYYIVAPKDAGPSLLDLINNPLNINDALIQNWDKYCRTGIKTNEPIDLSDGLNRYIKDFHFKIVSVYPMQTIIDEHRTTPYFPFRFGGGLTKKRPAKQNPPHEIEVQELTYISKIIAAYTDYKKTIIDSVEALQRNYPELSLDFNRQRERFYSAESLRVFVRETLPDESSFIKLKHEVYDGIIDVIEKDHPDGKTRLLNVMAQASQLSIQDNILAVNSYVSISDKQGLCHHLANEKSEVRWAK
ncbi:MAG: hypothetical protein A2Y23_08785 [Clostridiales bacterium GWB2_37_7]|nr:MAG: hypothetical protein A2Y23_08785 [Clostridiales bacterium GWB2_37_7]